MNQGWCYENKVKQNDVGRTILDFYQQFQHSTGQEWHTRIVSGQILLDGQVTSPETILKINQILSYHRPPWEEPPVSLDFEILYQDDDLWVIDKPSGLPVLPGGKFLDHTVLGQLRCHYGQETLVPIHRLGRGTSGILILARSLRARRALSQQMRDRNITKIYRALIGAGPIPNQFTITQPIGQLPYPKLGYIYGASSTGKTAESHCTVLMRCNESTVVEVKIKTGRPHQIRIHLASFGYPLKGDPLYAPGGRPYPIKGNEAPIPSDCGYLLHACFIKFVHPNGHEIEIEAPIPKPLKTPSKPSRLIHGPFDKSTEEFKD